MKYLKNKCLSQLAVAVFACNVSISFGEDILDNGSFDRQAWDTITQAELDQRNDLQAPLGPVPTDSTYYINKYITGTEAVGLPPVSAYVSDWGQYGRKVNIDKFAHGYDKLIFSFMGVCGTEIGDPSNVSAVHSLKAGCEAFGEGNNTLMMADIWGDIQSTAAGALTSDDLAALGNPDWLAIDDPTLKRDYWLKGQAHVAGLLGALYQIHQAYPEKTFALSHGGWSLSEAYSRVLASEDGRKTLIKSTIDVLKLFPMFTQVDIDWEYPGGGGASGNSQSESDGKNYALFIKEFRAALDKAGLASVKIAIAAAAPKEKIDAMAIKDLIDNGVEIIHLMTYDFFGEAWALGLDHHTNLYTIENGGDVWSTDQSVNYLIEELNVPASMIHIGYATYSRNAQLADIESISPLKGTFGQKSSGLAGGSWEEGVSEWYDIEKYLATISPETGFTIDKLDGYTLYTDTVANADYVYGTKDKFFMSFDTPRTVYLKARYVKEKGLGGLFTWMADYDNGYLLNAAREGLGYQLQQDSGNIDMEKIIFSCGENVTAEQCVALTKIADDDSVKATEAHAGSDVTGLLEEGKAYLLDGSQSTSAEGELKYKWTVHKVKGGISPKDIVIANPKSEQTHFTISNAGDLDSAVITFKLKVEDEVGTKKGDKVKFTLNEGHEENQAPVAEAEATPASVEVGSTFTLRGDLSSDPEGAPLSYLWVQSSGDPVSFDADAANAVVDTSQLKNKDHELGFTLTVNDGGLTDTDTTDVSVTANSANNIPPVGNIDVSGSLVVGGAITMDGTRSSDDGEIASYQWSVVNQVGEAVFVSESQSTVATFVPETAGDFTLSLQLTDNFGVSGVTRKNITIEENNAGEGTDPDAVNYPAWDSAATYTTGMMVSHRGYVFQCNYWSQGNDPMTEDHWNIQNGFIIPWAEAKGYDRGNVVSHDGYNWEATVWNQGSEPATGNADWKNIGGA